MSIVFLVLILGTAVYVLDEAVPKIIRAAADYRASKDGNLDGLIAEIDADRAIEVCVLAAIRRTDPELPDELVERMALTVLEDARDGVLGMTETSDPRGDA